MRRTGGIAEEFFSLREVELTAVELVMKTSSPIPRGFCYACAAVASPNPWPGVIKLNSSANKHQLPEGGLSHPSGPQVGLGAGPPPNSGFVCTVPEPVTPNINRTRETRKNFI